MQAFPFGREAGHRATVPADQPRRAPRLVRSGRARRQRRGGGAGAQGRAVHPCRHTGRPREVQAQLDRRHVHGQLAAVARGRRATRTTDAVRERRRTPADDVCGDRCSGPTGSSSTRKDGPHAWGRGNGFALLGLTEALTYLPADWPDRAARARDLPQARHARAGSRCQSDDGSWRQVVDEPTSYRELTVTAMTVAAMARGVRLGWLEPASSDRPSTRAGARSSRVSTRTGPCATSARAPAPAPTKEYYLNRPVVNGADDRGGAMALLAAIEVEELARSR